MWEGAAVEFLELRQEAVVGKNPNAVGGNGRCLCAYPFYHLNLYLNPPI